MFSEKAVLRGLVVILMLMHLGRWDHNDLRSLKTSVLESVSIVDTKKALHRHTASNDIGGGGGGDDEEDEEMNIFWPRRLHDFSTKVLQEELTRRGIRVSSGGGQTSVESDKATTITAAAAAVPPPPPPANNLPPPRLELLHIQKNAGSLLEVMALKANISWGVCHFDFPWKRLTPFKECPPLLDPKVTSSSVWWHFPLQYLNQTTFKIYPYDNHPNASYVARPKKYFVVIRNPYERLISMFYYSNQNKPRLTRGPGAPAYLNRWSQDVLKDGKIVGLEWENSTMCQHQYLFDTKDKPIPDVDHVVQFEYLSEDFNPLAQQYGLDLSIPERKENAHNYNNPDTLTVSDLDTTTFELMNTICEKDFALARGYEMLVGPPPKPSQGRRKMSIPDEPTKATTTNSPPPRLELLHIQKNAGSLLEVLALKANVPWGVCHFDFPWKKSTPYKKCPPLSDPKVTSRHVWWHYPLQYLNQTTFKIYPYDNHPNASYVARPKKYFVVVRNPYERLISMFYYSNKNKYKRQLTKGPGAKAYLNKWSQDVLKDGKVVNLHWENSTMCQHQYLFDTDDEPIPDVDHVVQFEYLSEDFNPLAKQYGLDLSIPEQKENAHDYTDPETLTVSDLDMTTIQLMNTICAKDFALGRGYEMLLVPPPKPTTATTITNQE